jgi:hypothetical protein
MNPSADRPFYYNHIQLDPNNPNRLYVLQVPAQVSEDGGKTFVRNLPASRATFTRSGSIRTTAIASMWAMTRARR